MPAKTVLDRARTDWFPKFLSQGQLLPVFQPIVDLRGGRVYGREALMRGRMGKSEVRGSELLGAAEVHDAIYSFDMRARAVALEVGLPRLPENEVLFVNLDPRGVVDVESSLRSTWPVVERLGAKGTSVGLEITHVERATELQVLEDLVTAHRERGAVIALDHLSAGGDSLRLLEQLKPELAKLDIGLCKGIERSSGRRRLVSALVEVAHELSCRVVATGIERDSELESVRDVGVDLVQGFYIGQPVEEMLPVDERVFEKRAAVG
jgi:EAL domain-containing protein (putative c-di-GMP-specific phosphodiesterase class I)